MKSYEIRLLLKTLSFKRSLVILLLALTIFYSLLEGAGIGLLLPVMQLVAMGDIVSLIEEGGIWKVLDSIYKTLNVPLNLSTLLLSVLLIILLKESMGYFQRVYSMRIGIYYTAHLKTAVFSKIINSDIGYFNNKKIGDMINTVAGQTGSAGRMVTILTSLITTSFLMVVYLFLLLMLSWQLTLLSLGVILILSISVQSQIRYSRKYGISLVKINNKFHSFLSQRLSGIRVIKAAATENRETKDLNRLAEEIALIECRQGISQGKIIFIFQVLTAAAVLVMFYSAVQIIHMPLTQLAVFFFILLRMTPYAMNINTQRHQLANYLSSVENVFKTLDEVTAYTKIKSGTRIFEELKEEIQLKNVSFSYDKIPVLKNINLNIRKGEMVAIVGASGAGKSTLADLFLRFYDPISGQITIDGVDIREFDLSSLRRKIGFVTQDIFLFNDAIETNISYGSNSMPEEEMIKAAMISNAHEFITKLPLGYKTVIGERGVKLSGGEKQRLALARAMLKKPQILILDEATSHLDSASERLIQESLNEIRRNYTIIAIAHRLSTIEHADKIVVVENGKIVEEGAHEELLKLQGYYAKYYALQTSAPIKY